MIYVSDCFSLQMFEKQSYTIQTRKIKKRRFLENTKDAISSIGSKKIARLLHKKVEKKEIRLERGDKLYLITSKFGRNKSDYKKENTYRFEEFTIN